VMRMGAFSFLELGEDFGCLTLQRSDEFGAHGVILKTKVALSYNQA
jgi:hypothetical protein